MARVRIWNLLVPTAVGLWAVVQVGLAPDGSPRDRGIPALGQDRQAAPGETFPSLGESADARAAPVGQITGTAGQALSDGGDSRRPARFRWVAPVGVERVRFQVSEPWLAVAAHAMDSRLVSGVPANAVAFPVLAGVEYSIEVRGNGTTGGSAVLQWHPDDGAGRVRNDDVVDADPIAGTGTGSHFAFIDPDAATVEPREPAATGVRTAWWAWTAPSSVRYAWQATAMIPHPLTLAVFSDGEQITLVGSGVATRRGVGQLVFDAVAGTRYLVAAGVDASDDVAAVPAGPIMFAWGPTPANDDRDRAAPLTGASGSASGSTEFATTQPGEQGGLGGDASVWWRWRAPQTRWYRFALDDAGAGAIAVYPTRTGEAIGPPLAISRATPMPAAVFEATAGDTYAIRVGHDPMGVERRFTLSWDYDAPPAWLRFGGPATDLDVSGERFAAPGGADRIAFNDAGDEMYVATEAGLAVYDRAASGLLGHRRTIAGVDGATRLFWDVQTRSLIAASCGALRKFPAAASGRGLTVPRSIAGRIPCVRRELAASPLLRDATGSFIHLAGPLGIATLRFDRDRSSLAFMRGTPVEGVVAAAALGADDAYLYAATEDGLRVFARDRNTGVLTAQGMVPPTEATGAAPIRLLEADAGGRYLYALTHHRRVRAYGLADPAMPVLVAETPPFPARRMRPGFAAPLPGARHQQAPCSFMGIRGDSATADVVCTDMAFSARLLSGGHAMRREEILYPGGRDGFGRSLPHFRLGQGVSVSPDERHIYAMQRGQLLVFERTSRS